MDKLPKLNINPHTITLSGFSAGGFLASQLHFIYSSRFKGLGLISGGPFSYFTERSKFKEAQLVQVENLIKNTYQFEKDGLIEPTKNIEGQNVLIYFGEKDKVLAPGVTEKANIFYEHFKADLKYVRNPDRNHSFPTDLPELCPKVESDPDGDASLKTPAYKARKKVDPDHQRFPYINNSGQDTAGMVLNYLYPDLKQRHHDWRSRGTLSSFDQLEYVRDMKEKYHCLNQEGYLYVPTECKNGELCHLHVVFHGAWQSPDFLGTTFVEHTGYLEWAAVNKIVLLFPQVMKTPKEQGNPKGAWDFWGYTDRQRYFNNQGVQNRTIMRMISHIAKLKDFE